MRKLIALTGVLAAALALLAAPAFTADSGNIVVSITAQAPPAPCLTVSPGSVNFGTLPFSANAGAGLSSGESDITITNCGTAGQNLLAATTDATGPSGSWTPVDFEIVQTVDPCTAPNRFYLGIFGFTTPNLYMIGTPRHVRASLGGPLAVFPVGDKVFRMTIHMPCQGSNGAGELKSMTATFTAVVA
jgi:hypothetical protein